MDLSSFSASRWDSVFAGAAAALAGTAPGAAGFGGASAARTGPLKRIAMSSHELACLPRPDICKSAFIFLASTTPPLIAWYTQTPRPTCAENCLEALVRGVLPDLAQLRLHSPGGHQLADEIRR